MLKTKGKFSAHCMLVLATDNSEAASIGLAHIRQQLIGAHCLCFMFVICDRKPCKFMLKKQTECVDSAYTVDITSIAEHKHRKQND